MRIFLICLLALILVSGCRTASEKKCADACYIEPTASPYVGQVRFESGISIRLLVLKHCPDSVANTDANEAVQAAQFAASKGLSIQSIGNFHINKDGKTNGFVWSEKFDLTGLKKFVSEQMKVNAKPGDTFVIYTLGHGSGNGSVMRLGQREGIMKMLAEAAEENEQHTFWWQLSCHAGVKLPPISTLTERQQELFSMTASSGSELSYFRTQGAIMKKVFGAIAEKSPAIDPDGDEIITAGELRAFITKEFGKKRGDLVFARSDDHPVFGNIPVASRIPIVDRLGPQETYPRDYVLLPKKRS